MASALQAHVPERVTRELALNRTGGRTRIRLSSNLLPVMGFETGARHTAEPVFGGYGIRVMLDTQAGTQRVYSRAYKRKTNNPFEAVLEIGATNLIDSALPRDAERVHFDIRHGEILITPVHNRLFHIRKRVREMADPRTAFVAMTAGIDCRAFEDNGFAIDGVCEYRPQEARDSADKTETGALNVLFNARPRVLFNEDVFRLDMDRLRDYAESSRGIGCLSLSLQCDDFSNAKADSLKARSLENLSTSADMTYPALRMVEEIAPATVMIENVPAYFSSPQYLQMLKPTLRRMGYFVQEKLLSGPDFGGRTLRRRGYMVASVFPGFEFPVGNVPEPAEGDLWQFIQPYLADCRDVTHCKAVHDGMVAGRDRHISADSVYAPTIMKSQSRQTKDAVYIKTPDGRYLLPSIELLAALQGLPADMMIDWAAGEVASEIIGQSVEFPMHDALIRSIGEHLTQQAASRIQVAARPSFMRSAPVRPVGLGASMGELKKGFTLPLAF